MEREIQTTLWDTRPSQQPSATHPAEFRLMRLRELPPTLADTPERVFNFWNQEVVKSAWYNGEVEQMVVMILNTRRKVTGFHLVAMGLLDTLLCHSREVFRTAIVANASAIVICHNHPSGDTTPSDADVRVTRDLIKAGQLLKVELLDHIVIGKPDPEANQKGYCSLREMGYFY